MTAVVDASALIALLADEPGGEEVAEILGSNGGSCSAINLAEVIDWLSRLGGVDAAEARRAVDAVVAAGLAIVPVDRRLAVQAGELRGRWYHRQTSAVSLADCVAIATAIDLDAPLVTSDDALCRTARRAGAKVSPIRNSAGRRPR